MVHLPAAPYNTNQLNPSYFSLGRAALQAPVANPYADRFSGSLASATIKKAQSLLPFPYYGAETTFIPHSANLIAHYLELSA
jgi:hypothetical protein